MNDRWLFLALIGFGVLAGWMLARSVIGAECAGSGRFHVGNTTYTCQQEAP